MDQFNLLDLDNDVLNTSVDYVKRDNINKNITERTEKRKIHLNKERNVIDM